MLLMKGVIMKRRTFLKAVGGAAGSYYLGQHIALGTETNSEEKTAEMPRRQYRPKIIDYRISRLGISQTEPG